MAGTHRLSTAFVGPFGDRALICITKSFPNVLADMCQGLAEYFLNLLIYIVVGSLCESKTTMSAIQRNLSIFIDFKPGSVDGLMCIV
jgi:hypothetical protein